MSVVREEIVLTDRSTGAYRGRLVLEYGSDEEQKAELAEPTTEARARPCFSVFLGLLCSFDDAHEGPHSYDNDPIVVAQRAAWRAAEPSSTDTETRR